jgi:hypothetical protein
MICPECRKENLEGVTRCDACGAELLTTLDEVEEDHAEWLEWVTVCEATGAATLAVVCSLLEAEQIPCVVTDALSQDLIGLGRLPDGVNLATGPARVQVPAELAEAARALIADESAALAEDADPTPRAG